MYIFNDVLHLESTNNTVIYIALKHIQLVTPVYPAPLIFKCKLMFSQTQPIIYYLLI
jgi:hypothetical protein